MTAEELYMQNRPLVRIGLRAAGIEEPDEDWLQNGRMWLWQACIAYDESRGLKFSTLAVASVFRGAKNRRIYLDRLCRRDPPMSLTHENDEGEDEQIDIPDDEWDPESRLRIEDFWQAAEEQMRPRDLDMLRMSAGGSSYAEIGRKYDITTQRVSQIYKRRILPIARSIAEHCLDQKHSQ